jgi:hypothetical protein
MKTSLTKLKSSLLLALIMISADLAAKPVAQVIEVTGKAFKITPDGKTSILRVNEHLDERSEVMVEEGGNVTLNDYFDATYHLIGGTHLKFFHQSAQLKQGKTWIKSKNHKHPLAVTTANGHVGFSKGEFIVTFDQLTSRSQVLVVNGDIDFSNVLEKDMKYSVSAGTFSLIDPEVEDGVPRAPTKVGLRSLDLALSEFKALPETLKERSAPSTTARSIASVEEVSPPVKKGEIIFLQSSRMPASINGGAHDYYKQTTKKKLEFNDVPIRFFGIEKAVVEKPRQPASDEGLHLDVGAGSMAPSLAPELERLLQELKSN